MSSARAGNFDAGMGRLEARQPNGHWRVLPLTAEPAECTATEPAECIDYCCNSAYHVSNRYTRADRLEIPIDSVTQINSAIADRSHSYFLLIRNGVVLPDQFLERVTQAVGSLNSEYPNWGMAGANGLLPYGVGTGAEFDIRYSPARTPPTYQGPNLAGYLLPAYWLYGGVLLFNARQLRPAGFQIPQNASPVLWEMYLSLEILARGKALVITPQLSALSPDISERLNTDDSLAEVQEHLLHRTAVQKLATPLGEVEVPGAIAKRFSDGQKYGFDPQRLALSNAAMNRRVKKVAIVTRTIYHRPQLLDRCIQTVQAFLLSAGQATEFEHYLITSNPDYGQYQPPVGTDPSTFYLPISGIADTRYLLVAAAAKEIEADYYWFIDDDDWMFPLHANHLGQVINTAPDGSPVFVKSMLAETATADTRGSTFPRFTVFHEYPASGLYRTLSFDSQTPFCSILLPRETLTTIPQEMYASLTLFEDLYTILFQLLVSNSLPVIVDELMVGITATSPDNTISRADRTPWDQAMSNIASELVQGSRGATLLANITQMLARQNNLEMANSALEAENLELRIHNDNARHQREQLEHQIEVIKRSATWRIGELALKPWHLLRRRSSDD